MSDCIFCKIAGGEIPSITLFEDDKVKVIFDAGPATGYDQIAMGYSKFQILYLPVSKITLTLSFFKQSN